MRAICKFEYKWHSNWQCKNFKEEYTIETLNSVDKSVTNRNHVAKIRIHDKNEDFFPEGMGSYFPHLNILIISCCGLKSITRYQLRGLENLMELNLTSNFLTSLPDDLFIGMSRLKRISFKDNKLKAMSSKLLEPILKNAPTLIDFRGNLKIDEVYDSKKAEGMSLEELMNIIDVECIKPADEHVYVSTVESFEKDFTTGFADIWESGDHSDFTIIVNDQKEFRVHKTVLAVQSPVFAAMFKSDMEEQQAGKMSISEFSAEAVEQFLASLYTGQIKDVSYAMELFALASKYDVTKLREASEHNVLQCIDSSNACEVFALGHLYSSSVMQREAFDVIKKSLPDIELDEDLTADPERLKAMVIAIEKRNKKMQEVEDEFKSACKLCKK